MVWWLVTQDQARVHDTIEPFDPRFWTVNFSRPMMAAVTTIEGGMRVDAVYYRKCDLAALIWEAEDRWNHPFLAFQTRRDFRGHRMRFRWRSAGIVPLDQVNGPVLTIEGRTAAGAVHTWYVRLWNYATGSGTDATISLDFDAMAGGFILPGEADPVYAGDIDRMFFSLAPTGFDAGSTDPLPATLEGWVEITALDITAPPLTIGADVIDAHEMRIATGYDDSYNLTPERILWNARNLGYRAIINHYVGMSHYFRLEPLSGGFYVSFAGGTLNTPCNAWHLDFARRAHALGYVIIWSLSYELFNEHCYNDWKQRAESGAPALTGWVPPSTLLSPAHSGAMFYLRAIGLAFVSIALAAEMAVHFQVGEPWWWTDFVNGHPHIYDGSAVAALGGSVPSIPTVWTTGLNAGQKAALDAAGGLLAASTAALTAAIKAAVPTAKTYALVYLPTVLSEMAPDLKRATLPTGWARPAFDVLQCEDYDWVVEGSPHKTAAGIAEITSRLGYPLSEQHYFSGFVLHQEASTQWNAIHDSAVLGIGRGTPEVFVWALPQVTRDGFVYAGRRRRMGAAT